MTYLVKILVEYKPGLLDPEAKTIEKAARGNLGFDIAEFKTGKHFTYISKKLTRHETKKEAVSLADTLLANTVIENYTLLSIKKQE